MEEEEYIAITRSYLDAEDFKYNLERKKKVASNLKKNLLALPIVIYVKNPDITDITKTVYIMFMYENIDALLEKVKCYMTNEDPNTTYVLKTEQDEEEGGLLGDIPLLEIYQEFKNRDGFLYMILDKS